MSPGEYRTEFPGSVSPGKRRICKGQTRRNPCVYDAATGTAKVTLDIYSGEGSGGPSAPSGTGTPQ